MNLEKWMRARYRLFLLANVLLIVVWAAYLFTVQVFDPHGIDNVVDRRYITKKELTIPLRGLILDRNNVTLVKTTRYYQLDYDKGSLPSYKNSNAEKLNEDLETIANVFTQYTELSKQFYLNKLKGSSRSVYLSDKVRETDKLKIEKALTELGLAKGLIFSYSSQRRDYPNDALAARLLGACSEEKDPGSGNTVLSKLVGSSGLEATFNNELKGVYGWKTLYTDGYNRPVIIPRLRKQDVKNGHSLVLTIDSRIQEIFEIYLKEGVETFKAKNAIGILMDPKTGEVLAMASVSDSDKRRKSDELRVFTEMGVSFMFEPGSTLKPFTALAALEKQVYSPTDMIDCRTYHLKGRTIRDAHPFEFLSFKDVIVHSSNVGISKVAEKIGPNALYEELISLNFGKMTSADFYAESAGSLRKLNQWQGFSLHSISFGQEISVTPIQLTAAYAALANEGIMMRPYIVKEIVNDKNEVIKKIPPKRMKKVSQKKAIDALNDTLAGVVEYGTGTGTKIPNVPIAGKTGTAEKQTEGKGYTKGKYVSNFVGFFPANDPKYAGLILYDEPSYAYHYASMSAAVTFRKIVEKIITLPDYEHIAMPTKRDKEFIAMIDVMGLSLTQAEQNLKNNGIKYKIYGEGDPYKAIIVNQYPKSSINFDKTEEVMLVIGNESFSEKKESPERTIMPTLIGLTVREAIQQSKMHNVELEILGKGIVTFQSIPAGSQIEYGAKCKISAS